MGHGSEWQEISLLDRRGGGQALDLIGRRTDFLENSLYFPANPCIRPVSGFLNSN